jgi:tetratricopeptide (TPR) repeat protein
MAVSTGAQAQSAREPAEWTYEFPRGDSDLAARIDGGFVAQRTARELAGGGPVGADTIGYLLATDRVGEAIRVLPRVWSGPVSNTVRTLEILSESSFRLTDDAHDYRTALQQALTPLRARLGDLRREDAARIAYTLVSYVDWIVDPDGTRDPRSRRAAFMREYAGTAAAELAQVDDLMSGTDSAAQHAALDRYVREHPNTEASARALVIRAGLFTREVSSIDSQDPTDAMLEVFAIVRALETGGYPSSRWVDRAPELVTSLFVSDPLRARIPAANVGRLLAAYDLFVREHFDRPASQLRAARLGWIVTHSMGDLFALKGERAAGIERTFAALEREARNPDEIRLQRAEFYRSESFSGSPEEQRTSRARALDLYRSIAAAGSGQPSRQALATLAKMAFDARDCQAAVPLLQEYTRRYADSAWSWVAALRVGVCAESAGDWTEAAAVYARAAAAYETLDGPAAMTAHALAGHAYDTLGQFQGALAAYRRALERWDDGFRYTNFDRSAMGREAIAERVDTLARVLAIPNGEVLARAQSLMDQGRHGDAAPVLAEFLRGAAPSTETGTARSLLHRAQLLNGLRLANVYDGDATAAAAAFDELGREPFDFNVAAGLLARASLSYQLGGGETAAAAMREVLDRLVLARRPASDMPLSGIDADLAAIRNLLFRPGRALTMADGRELRPCREGASVPLFPVVHAGMTVRYADGREETRPVFQVPAEVDRALVLTREELGTLETMLETFQPSGGMPPIPGRTPRPVAANVADLWRRFFSVRIPGGLIMSGWSVGTCPGIGEIEFLDDTRTRASVWVGSDNDASERFFLEKREGGWQIVGVSNLMRIS